MMSQMLYQFKWLLALDKITHVLPRSALPTFRSLITIHVNAPIDWGD